MISFAVGVLIGLMLLLAYFIGKKIGRLESEFLVQDRVISAHQVPSDYRVTASTEYDGVRALMQSLSINPSIPEGFRSLMKEELERSR